MRRFAEQVRQVGIVYVTQIRGWVWALAFVLLLFVLFGLFGRETSNLSILSYANMSAIFLGTWIVEQLKHQFAHSRARLLPEFNSAHLAIPLILILFGCIGLPTIAATMGRTSPLPYVAASSFGVGVFLLLRLLPKLSWLIAAIIFVIIWRENGRDTEINTPAFLLNPALNIPLFVFGWLGIGCYFFKLLHLAEDDTVYRQLSDETLVVAAAGDERFTRAKYNNTARSRSISDRWHAKLGGFHQYRKLRIVRLLRYGFGATPVEHIAIGSAIIMSIVVIVIVNIHDGPYSIARSTDATFLIMPAIFSAMAPFAVAGGAIGWRVPRLRNEILFPLTRRELIDGLMLTAAWHSLVIWLLGCACGTGILLYALPVEAKSVSLFVTAAFLTGAVAVAAFGLSLHIVMWETKFAQLFALGLFVVVCIAMMTIWWISREDLGDAPYWVMAAMVMGVGAMMTHTGRTVWLNQEFG